MRLHFHKYKWGRVEGGLSYWANDGQGFIPVRLQQGECRKCGLRVWKELWGVKT